MTTEQAAPAPVAEQTAAPAGQQPLAAWFARLGVSGKVLGIAAVLGIIAMFLPGLTFTSEMPTLKIGKAAPTVNFNISKSTMVLDDWRGKVELVGFIGALVLLFVLYPTNGLAQKNLCWIAVGVGGLVVLLGIWMLAAYSGGDFGFMKISPGFGAYASLLAGIAVTVGAFLKARDEKLI